MPSFDQQIPDDAGVQPAQGLQLQGKFGAPPANPQEESTFSSEWENFFNKLKTDTHMQEALLKFSSNVTSGKHNGTVNAVAASASDAVSGYNEANRLDAARATKLAMDKSTHDAEILKTWSEIAKNHGLTEEAGANAGKARADTKKSVAEASRTTGAIDLDAANAELARARAAEAWATAKAGGKGKKAPDKTDKLAVALLAKGLATDSNDAYIQATEMMKSPALSKIAADFINSQGFLYGDNLPEKTKQAVQTAVGAGKGLTPGLGVPSGGVPIPMQTPNLSELRKMADHYTTLRNKPPVSDAKLIELSKSPEMILQLKNAMVPVDDTSDGEEEDDSQP